MSWRERSANARLRGYFNEADWAVWEEPACCVVGEQVRATGLDYNTLAGKKRYDEIERMWMGAYGVSLQWALDDAMRRMDFDKFDKIMSQVEDAALTLKREG